MLGIDKKYMWFAGITREIGKNGSISAVSEVFP